MKDKILIVDDSASARSFFKEKLSNKFEVLEAYDSQQGLDLFYENNLLAILIDVSMPVINGFELGLEIQRLGLEKSRRTAIVYISANEDEWTILKCFDSGAHACIPKVIEGDALVAKIESIADYTKRAVSLYEDILQLNQHINTSIWKVYLDKDCLSLLSRLNHVDNEQGMANCIFSFMEGCNIDTAIEFKNEGVIHNYDQLTGQCSPIEKCVFELLRDKGQIYEFGNRVVLNHENISLLIKNMPSKSSESYSLLIDVLAKLTPALEARYISLCNSRQLEKA